MMTWVLNSPFDSLVPAPPTHITLMYREPTEEGNAQGYVFKSIQVDSALAIQLHT